MIVCSSHVWHGQETVHYYIAYTLQYISHDIAQTRVGYWQPHITVL